jgi:hypothetical protein
MCPQRIPTMENYELTKRRKKEEGRRKKEERRKND